MITTYKLNTRELTDEIIRSIKEAFKDKDIEITVSDQMDETDYLLSTEANRKHLYESMKELEEGKGISMSLADLKERYLK